MTSTRTRPGRKATATRQRILDAAAKLFGRYGYTGTRLADIAIAAHIQVGSMYYHFPSREDLVKEVLRVGQQRTIDFVTRRVDTLPAGTNSADRLREAISAHLEAVLELGDYTAATQRILGQVPAEIRGDTLALQRGYGRYWRDLFESARTDGEIREDLDLSACRMLVIGAMNASPDWFHHDQPDGLTVAALEEQFTAVIFDGLGTARGRGRRTGALEITLPPERADAAPAGSRGAATTARILDAAAKVFRENGYAGARLVDVAAHADVQTGSLYYHFESREDLVTRLLHDAWERTHSVVRRGVEDLPADTAPVNRLATAMTAHLLSVLSGGDYTSAMLRILGQVPDDVRGTIQPLQRAHLDLWRGLFQEATGADDIRADLDPSVVLMMLTGALNWTVEWYDADHHPAPGELARQFCTLVFEGMSTQRGNRPRSGPGGRPEADLD
jgi:TetR/AcrR family transcriptional regulator, cholesterol catabolism regulator